MLDRALFFAAVRASFGRLSQSQVDGFTTILDAWDLQKSMSDPRWLAYILATAWHEVAETMQPIRERGGAAYFFKMYDMHGSRPKVAATLGNTQPGDGAKFYGRGLVQLTGRTNYARASQKLGADLIANPDLALKPVHAVKITFAGMKEGWFTGKKLADYFSATKDDPVGARRIINGTDKAETIASHHRKFLAALKAADRGTVTVPVRPPPDIEPTAPKPARPASAGFFVSLLRLFRKA